MVFAGAELLFLRHCSDRAGTLNKYQLSMWPNERLKKWTADANEE